MARTKKSEWPDLANFAGDGNAHMQIFTTGPTATGYELLSNGSYTTPELVFAAGDVIYIESR